MRERVSVRRGNRDEGGLRRERSDIEPVTTGTPGYTGDEKQELSGEDKKSNEKSINFAPCNSWKKVLYLPQLHRNPAEE